MEVSRLMFVSVEFGVMIYCGVIAYGVADWVLLKSAAMAGKR